MIHMLIGMCQSDAKQFGMCDHQNIVWSMGVGNLQFFHRFFHGYGYRYKQHSDLWKTCTHRRTCGYPSVPMAYITYLTQNNVLTKNNTSHAACPYLGIFFLDATTTGKAEQLLLFCIKVSIILICSMLIVMLYVCHVHNHKCIVAIHTMHK
jgi:hypothetical protein